MSEYLARTAREITNRAKAEVGSASVWEPLRETRLRELREMLGLWPWPECSGLNARVTDKQSVGDYRIECIEFESLPKVYVTANLYLPARVSGPLPTVLYACGHAYSENGAKAKYQRHGAALARNGYVALVIDPIQLSETFALHYGIYYREMYEWYARGYTPAGVEAWNAIRALDYLETRAEVDRSRFGMTGRSGGAANTWFTAAIDPRIRVAAAVMGISTYAANVRQNTQKRHCDCMYAINSRRHDLIHLGALIAPRPLLMAHGIRDLGFPAEGYREFESAIGALYNSYAAPEAFRNIEVDTDHADSDYLREQALIWFDRHLAAYPERKPELSYTEVPEAALSVFKGKPPADALNFSIHGRFVPTPSFAKLRTRADWEERRDGVLSLLRGRVFTNLRLPWVPRDVSAHPGPFFEEMRVCCADGVDIRMLLRRPSRKYASAPGLLYVASPSEDAEAVRQLLHPAHLRDSSVRLVVYPRGAGEKPWTKSAWKALLRNAMQVGLSVDEMRLRDVLAGLHILRQQPGVDAKRITLFGRGEAGILALYAAVLDPSVSQVILHDPPATHVHGPIFLNVLRYTDIPEVAALLAPRRLVFYSCMPEAFGYTAKIYSVVGAAEHVQITMNIEATLEHDYGRSFPAQV